MANWNNSITVEIRLPYYTQGGTIGHLTAELNVTKDDIWFSGNDCDSRVWKANIHWGDYPLLIVGKATNTPKHGDRATTFRVQVYHTFDGMNPAVGYEGPRMAPRPRKYPIRVLSYN